MSQLRDFEKRLSEHFAQISGSRENGKTFLIEHGLESEDLQALLFAIGERGGQFGFHRKLWDEFPFALCVALTEFGYSYSGNDFWPTAERGLKAEIRIDDRAEITEQFRHLHARIGIAPPLDDSWSEAFNHIAWPIRNAMVPRELHAPVARILRETLRHTQTLRLDAQFLGLVKSLAGGMNSRRLDAWLADEALALMIVRSLLSDDFTAMGVERFFLARLGKDLRENSEFRKLSLAVRARTVLGKPRLTHLPGARLQLLLRDVEPLGIAVRGPKLGPGEKLRVRDELSVSPATVRILFGAKSTSLEAFLGGEMLFLGKPVSVPEPELKGLKDVPPAIAAAVSPPTSLLFHDNGDDGFQPQFDRHTVLESGNGFYELRLEGASQHNWAEQLHHFVSGQPEGDKRLAAHGMRVADKPLLRFYGGMTLTKGAELLQQNAGRILRVQATSPGTTVEIKCLDTDRDRSLTVPTDSWVRFPATEGTWRIDARNREQEETLVVEFRAVSPPDPVRVQLQPEGLGLQDIAGGGASVSLWAPVALHDSQLEIAISAATGETVQIKVQVPLAPCVFAFDAAPFAPIRDAARRWARSGAPAQLQVAAIGLDQHVWILPSQIPKWRVEAGVNQWLDEDGFRVPGLISDPTENPAVFKNVTDAMPGRTVLAIPATDAEARVFSGIMRGAVDQIRLGDFDLPKRLSLGRAPHDAAGTIGLIGSTEALIAWRTAFAPTAVTEALRARSAQLVEDSLVATICGEDWLETERRSRGMSGGFHRRLALLACERKLAKGNDECFSPLPPQHEPALVAFLESAFRQALPEVEIITVPDDEYWPELDDAVNKAWEGLMESVQPEIAGLLWSDAKCPDRAWHSAVQDASAMTALPQLAKWILPGSRRDALATFDYEATSFPDLVAEIELCHHDLTRTGGRWITPADMRALLLLFLAPAQLAGEPEWRGRIARFGSDRFSARAIRYAALRKAALRQGCFE